MFISREAIKAMVELVNVLYPEADDKEKRDLRHRYALSYEIGKSMKIAVTAAFHAVNHKNDYPTELRTPIREWCDWYNDFINDKKGWLNACVNDYHLIENVATGVWVIEDGMLKKAVEDGTEEIEVEDDDADE